MFEFPQSLGLDLPNSLTRHRELLADLLQGMVAVRAETKAHTYDALLAVCTENLNADVMMMKSAKDRVWTNGPEPLNRARDWRILVQRPVCPDVVIIATIGAQDAAQMRLARDNEIVQAFARIEPINRSAYPFCQGEAGAVGLSRIPIAWIRRVTNDP